MFGVYLPSCINTRIPVTRISVTRRTRWLQWTRLVLCLVVCSLLFWNASSNTKRASQEKQFAPTHK